MLYRLGLQYRSKIDILLEKHYSSKNSENNEITLQLLMDQDDFLQEIKSQNDKLYDL